MDYTMQTDLQGDRLKHQWQLVKGSVRSLTLQKNKMANQGE
jgi:hypothetical protein